MFNKNDRLDMLKKISLIDKYDNLSIFESYIPKHYDEIYSIYTLLVESNIDYNDIMFNEPSEQNDGSLNIKFICSHEVYSKLKKFIEKNKVIKYLRKKSFSIELNHFQKNDFVDVILTFNKI